MARLQHERVLTPEQQAQVEPQTSVLEPQEAPTAFRKEPEAVGLR